MLGAVIDDLAINLITHDGNLWMALKPGDEPVEFGARHHAAGRISRAVDDQQPGLRRYFFQHLVGAERKSLALIERHRYRRCAGKPDDALIDWKTGIRIENFGPGLAEHHDREKHRDLAARHDKHKVGRDLNLVASIEIGGDRF